MNATTQYMISKDNGKLQIPYEEYMTLMEKIEEAQRIQQVKTEVLAQLQRHLGGHSIERESSVEEQQAVVHEEASEPVEAVVPVEEAKPEKVSLEFAPEEPEGGAPANAEEESAPGRLNSNIDIPPIKKEIESHFNAHDGSGRLLNVFKQYYTCLNESCGGIVRVTMKDGICSLWNYDEWEEFAFADIYEGDLRLAVDPRYTDELSALEFCEVPRLLASRRNLISIQVGDLNKTMLGVLTKAFDEVGLAAG